MLRQNLGFQSQPCDYMKEHRGFFVISHWLTLAKSLKFCSSFRQASLSEPPLSLKGHLCCDDCHPEFSSSETFLQY